MRSQSGLHNKHNRFFAILFHMASSRRVLSERAFIASVLCVFVGHFSPGTLNLHELIEVALDDFSPNCQAGPSQGGSCERVAELQRAMSDLGASSCAQEAIVKVMVIFFPFLWQDCQTLADTITEVVSGVASHIDSRIDGGAFDVDPMDLKPKPSESKRRRIDEDFKRVCVASGIRRASASPLHARPQPGDGVEMGGRGAPRLPVRLPPDHRAELHTPLLVLGLREGRRPARGGHGLRYLVGVPWLGFHPSPTSISREPLRVVSEFRRCSAHALFFRQHAVGQSHSGGQGSELHRPAPFRGAWWGPRDLRRSPPE